MKLTKHLSDFLFKKFQAFLILVSLSILSIPVKAEDTLQEENDFPIFVIETLTGEPMEIPLGDNPIEIKKISENDGFTILELTTGESNYVLELSDILRFSLILPASSGIGSIFTPDSRYWEIYGTDGVLWQKGEGKPDLTSLPKGKVFIVKQGNASYKIMSK